VFAYIVRRLIIGFILLIVMSFLTFVLFFSSTVHPEDFACGKNCSPQLKAQVKKQMGYDDPVIVQWGDFMKGIVQGRDFPDDPELKKAAPETIARCDAPCLGYSRQLTAPVLQKVSESWPVSVSLALTAFVMWMVGGISFGVIAALRRGTFIDRGLVGLSLIFYAFPTFFIGLFFLKYISIRWEIVPLPIYKPIAEYGVGPWLQGLLLPGLTLALVYLAGYVRMTRAFVLESQTEDYMRTAKAKGLKPFRILYKHNMRAALTPLVTMAGLDLAGLIGGAIITEQVFNYPGLGKLAVNAVVGYDLPIVVGIVLVLAAVVIVANLIVDILYAVIDPRVRVG
jgi:peptide/nickel transport system permease protein